MLPDYPNIKRNLINKFNEAIRNEIQKDPLFSKIKIHYVNEGNVMISSSMDGYSEKKEYEEMSTRFEIKTEEIISKGPNAYFSRIKTIAKEMIKKQHQSLFKKMHEVTQRTGNVVDAKSKPLSPQLINEALEKVTIDFDEYGNPIFPSLVMHPDQFEKIKDQLPIWESDPEVQKRYKEIIEKKRREWFDRESNRKLVN